MEFEHVINNPSTSYLGSNSQIASNPKTNNTPQALHLNLIIVTKLYSVYTGEVAIFLLRTLIAALHWSVCHAESCLHLARGFRKGVCL